MCLLSTRSGSAFAVAGMWLLCALVPAAQAAEQSVGGSVASADATEAVPAISSDVEYGPHGGVVGLPAGSYVCLVYDDAKRECLVRAITEAEIAYAIAAEGDPNGPPGWMRASVDVAVSAAAIGLTVDNVYGLPGLMKANLNPVQVALVRCLANTELGRALAQWDNAAIYREGIVERCADETGFEGAVPHLANPSLPLAPRHIQEAVIIAIAAQRLASSNVMYSTYAGRYADSVVDLISSAVMPAMPAATPSMSGRGYVVARDNRIVVDLKSPAIDVCRALNMIYGRPWAAPPEALPGSARAGCYPIASGFRFEARP